MLGRIPVYKVFYFVMFMVMAAFLFGSFMKIVIIAYLLWLCYKFYNKIKQFLGAP